MYNYDVILAHLIAHSHCLCRDILFQKKGCIMFFILFCAALPIALGSYLYSLVIPNPSDALIVFCATAGVGGICYAFNRLHTWWEG